MTHTIRKVTGAFAGRFLLGRAPSLTHQARVWGAIAATLFAAPLAAQPVGEGPLVLRVPTSARFLALSQAGLVSTDGDAMFYNPGMLASSRGAAASLQRYGASAVAGSMATISTMGSMTVGIGAQFVRYEAAPTASYNDITRGGAPQLGEAVTNGVSATSTALTVGFAKTIKGFRLGANAKYVEDRIGLASDGTVAFDIGLNRAAGFGTLGIVMQNLGVGPRISGVKGTLPRRIGAGFGAARPIATHWDIGLQSALTLEGDLFVRPALGGELSYVPVDGVSFTLRQGFRRPREAGESFITAGVGMTIDRIALDYALEPMREGRPTAHRVGMRIR
ncbi:MAG: hypothetical protein IT353_16985 [Gemmatimonadaceae bacterium]|nr:hypothetical protein [Gemmatimonadaceae bacterium]